MIGIRNCYFLFLSIFGILQLIVFYSKSSFYFKIPILVFFIISILYSLFILNSTIKNKTNHIIYLFNLTFSYLILSLLGIIISPIVINAKELYDIHIVFSSIIIFSLTIGLILGWYFLNHRDFRKIQEVIKIRENDIEVKSVNFWSELSLDKAPWLKKPLQAVKYGFVSFTVFIGGSAVGISLAIAEGLKRSDLLSSSINTHAFLFFILGVPVALASGILLYPLLSYLYRWRKLVKEIKQEYGSYTVLLNLENKPYSELKQELSEG